MYGILLLLKHLKLQIKAFSNSYKQLDKVNNIEMSSIFQLVDSASKKLIDFKKRNLRTNFIREDYPELVQLCLLYLGNIEEIFGKHVSF